MGRGLCKLTKIEKIKLKYIFHKTQWNTLNFFFEIFLTVLLQSGIKYNFITNKAFLLK